MDEFIWTKIEDYYQCEVGGYRFLILKNKERLRHTETYHFYTVQIYRKGKVQPFDSIPMVDYLKVAKRKCVEYYNEMKRRNV